MIQFQVERFSDFIEEAIPLLHSHYEETALDKTVPLDPNFRAYLHIDAAGLMHVVTARHEGEMVGFSSFIIHRRNLHYNVSVAQSDIFYLAPEFRKGTTEEELLKFSESSLRDLGIDAIVSHTDLSPQHDLGPLLEHLGFNAIERVYSKKLI